MFGLLCAKLLFHICEKKIGIRSVWTQLLAEARLGPATEKIRFPRNSSRTVQYPQTKKVCVEIYMHLLDLKKRVPCPLPRSSGRAVIHQWVKLPWTWTSPLHKQIHDKNKCALLNKTNRKLRLYFYSSLSLRILIIFFICLVNTVIHASLID